MTENQEFIYESIFCQVRMGFSSIEEIKENIVEEVEDNGFEDEISGEWATDLINKEFEKLLNESKNWRRPTDTEKLVKAFDELCTLKIIALHNAGYTTSDGECAVIEVEGELNKKGVASEGYCFYHEQDLSRAIDPENPSLYITFQKIDNSNDEITMAIGKKVVEVLKKNGFNVEWNETATTKILILDFKWQKMYDDCERDLLDYDNIVKLMTKKADSQ